MTTPQGLIDDLRDAGVTVGSLSELVRFKRSYQAAIPVLLDWLANLERVPRQDRTRVHEMLVRSVAVPGARGVAAPLLVKQFRQVSDPSGLGIRWVIGDAIAVMADDAVFQDLVELASDKKYGRAREMLMLALAQTRHEKAPDVLIDLLNDDQVAGHAVIALGRLGSPKGRAAVEGFLEHPKPWVRQEAKKALAKLRAGD